MTTEVPELKVYPPQNPIPDALYYQAWGFVRMLWFDGPHIDIDRARRERRTFVVVERGNLLISAAQVLTTEVVLNGQHFSCGGLGGVMTFPGFRRQGYGAQVVGQATDTMRAAAVDVGLLWTSQPHIPFYTRQGWENMPEMQTLIGTVEAPEVYENDATMMIFFSERAQGARHAFQRGRLYVGPRTW